MSAEEELRNLRNAEEKKQAKYRQRHKIARFVNTFLFIVALGTIVYSIIQKVEADRLKSIAENDAREVEADRIQSEQKMKLCGEELNDLRISLLECQNQTPKK